MKCSLVCRRSRNLRATIAILGLLFSLEGWSQSQIIEDWDTTPPIPDESRGWGSQLGPVLIEQDPQFGNIARAISFQSPHSISVPWQSDSDDWITNQYIGDKDYSALDVSAISFYVRHDEVPGTFQALRFPVTIILTSATEVPSPLDPGEIVRPFVWSTSESELVLGEGWEFFRFDVPSNSLALPAGWSQYPDEQNTWRDIITDVDQVTIFAGEVLPGTIGGIPLAWETPVAEFVIQLGGNDAIAIPTLSAKAVAILLLVLIIAGGASLWRVQAGNKASALKHRESGY